MVMTCQYRLTFSNVIFFGGFILVTAFYKKEVNESFELIHKEVGKTFIVEIDGNLDKTKMELENDGYIFQGKVRTAVYIL